MPFIRSCLSVAPFLLPVAAVAHPHVYIDAGLELIFNEAGDLTGIEVEWAYDELYSLLIISDHALDSDGDGKLTSDEKSLIQGFDSDWPPESEGGLYLRTGGEPVDLAAPEDFTAEYRDGRLISRHRRSLPEPLAGEFDLLIQVYDPEFYVDFSMPSPPLVTGNEGCRIELEQGDAKASAEAYREAIDALLGSDADSSEADLVTVDIGAAGADEVHVRCGG